MRLSSPDVKQAAQIPQNEQVSFEDLAVLNAGVILAPLAEDTPIYDIPGSVIQGLASLPRRMVKTVVIDHTEPGLETRQLIERFDAIVQSAKNQREVLAGPVEHDKAINGLKTRRKAEEAKTLEQEIGEVLDFSNPDQPVFDGLSKVIERHPNDPALVEIVYESFSTNGHDLSDLHKNGDLAEKVMGEMAKGYDKRLFNAKRLENNQIILATMQTWCNSITNKDGLFTGYVKSSVIEGFMKAYDPEKTTAGVKQLVGFMHSFFKQKIEVEKLGYDIYRFSLKSIFMNLGKKLRQYPPHIKNSVKSDYLELAKIIRDQPIWSAGVVKGIGAEEAVLVVASEIAREEVEKYL